MPRLADQDAQPHHAQILALALGVSALGELTRRQGGDVGVEVRGVEREHVRRQLEPGDGRLRDRHLRLLQFALGNLLGDAMKRLRCLTLPASR